MSHVRLGYLHGGQHPYGSDIVGTVYSCRAFGGFHEMFHGLKAFHLAELCINDIIRVDIKPMVVKSFKISSIAPVESDELPVELFGIISSSYLKL